MKWFSSLSVYWYRNNIDTTDIWLILYNDNFLKVPVKVSDDYNFWLDINIGSLDIILDLIMVLRGFIQTLCPDILYMIRQMAKLTGFCQMSGCYHKHSQCIISIWKIPSLVNCITQPYMEWFIFRISIMHAHSSPDVFDCTGICDPVWEKGTYQQNNFGKNILLQLL